MVTMRRAMDAGDRRLVLALRVLGVALLLGGLALGGLAMWDYLVAFGNAVTPQRFWCFFAGIGTFFVGLLLTQYAFADNLLFMLVPQKEPERGYRFRTAPRATCPCCRREGTVEDAACPACGAALPMPRTTALGDPRSSVTSRT